MLEDILIALIGVECLLIYFTEERMISKKLWKLHSYPFKLSLWCNYDNVCS